MDRYIGSIEASRFFNCAIPTIYDWCIKGWLKHKTGSKGKRKILLISFNSSKKLKASGKTRQKGLRTNPRKATRKIAISNGYRMVYKPEHPRCYNDGYIAEHILVAEKKLGRYLVKGEQVHHINRIRHDNSPENLIVFPSFKEHMDHHRKDDALKTPRISKKKPHL